MRETRTKNKFNRLRLPPHLNRTLSDRLFLNRSAVFSFRFRGSSLPQNFKLKVYRLTCLEERGYDIN